MAVVRLLLAAQQDRVVQKDGIEGLFDAALPHQREEGLLVRSPVSLALPEFVEHRLRRRQVCDVDVPHATEFLEEVLQVVSLREASELRDVVQPYVDESGRTRLSEESKERAGGLLAEADRVELDDQSTPPCRTASPSFIISAGPASVLVTVASVG
jgi:hypothetical protein